MKSISTNSHRSNRFHLFILAVFLVVISASSAQAQITYVYDELGRVIAVTDPGGDTVRYNYDAVGNITSISRAASSTLSFINFSPGSGPVGATVTIYGTAFSTTPANNTVTFNGTAATVTASTATKITTTVPSGATTGVIQVTVSAVSVSSSSNFTVTSSATPTISAISPTIGTGGTGITVTGTNFDTTATKNKTKLNITNALVSSATSTSISTSVPTFSGSGKISVTTANGTATSTDDFFVPPSPYTASDVVQTGRMSPGGSQTVTISTATKVGLILFDATAGQRATIKVTSCTFSSTFLSIYQPNGTLHDMGSATSGSNGFMTTTLFTASGTYAILVDPLSNNTGAITFDLYTFTDNLGTITPGGSAVSVSTSTMGQMALLSFSGTANQRVSVKMTSGSWTGGSPSAANVSIMTPVGTTLATQFTQTTAFLDTQTLPVTGTYTLIIDPSNLTTGSVTLTLYDVGADISGSITAGGSAVTVSPSIPGLNGVHTFSGTSGQRVSLKVTSGSWTGGSPSAADVYIKKPDGTTLATVFTTTTGFIDVQTLPTTGTYTVLTDPSGASTGTLTLTLYDVPADASGSLTLGTGSSSTNTVPGQNSLLTFSGTGSQRVSLVVSGGSLSGGVSGNSATVYIKKPDGTTLTSVFVLTSGFIDTQTLPTTGTYTVLTDPSNSAVGSFTITGHSVTDSSGTVTINGGATTVTTSTPGQNGDYTFSGTASQQVTVSVASNTTSCVTVTLKKPDGSTLTSTFSCGGSFSLSQQTLPTTGTYTIRVDPNNTNTGSLNLSVTSP
jgi:YD repeat-containing protein